MTGKIIKGIAGFYYVDTGKSGVYQCKAKGLFRRMGIKPLVGDEVRISVTHEADMEANIEEIFPRRNELYRPAVSNVDQAVIVVAAENPKPELLIIDRFLIQMQRQSLSSIIAVNKRDLDVDDLSDKIKEIYESAGYKVLIFSIVTGDGFESLMDCLKNKTSVLAGPSGVGKSSIVNALTSSKVMETGEVSAKLKKGKNTTRHVQLVSIGDNSFICDTPGFTSFEAESMPADELQNLFPEIRPLKDGCRFALCSHISEPDCAVKAAVEDGKISAERYSSYIRIYKELMEAKKDKYK